MSKGKKDRASRASRTVPLEALQGILQRTRAVLSEQDQSVLQAAVETLAFLSQELQAKGATIERLRRMLFGASSEKTSRVIAERDGHSAGDGGAPGGEDNKPKPKAPGHGRNGAAAYRGAQKVKVAHLSLSAGDRCPECPKGRLYPLSEPAVLLRVIGMAPLSATVYELDRLRCNLCGQVFTAPAPAGLGEAKYDETAASMDC